MATEIEASRSAPKVFATFELLEMILIYLLDPEHKWDIGSATMAKKVRRLFRLQRVNSTFRDLLVRSKRLRVAMFRSYGDVDDDPCAIRQLLCVPEESPEQRKLVINPLLPDLHDCTKTYYTNLFLTYWNDEGYETGEKQLQGTVIADWTPKKMPRHGTWRSLPIANQPRPFRVRVDVRLKRGDRPCQWRYINLEEDATLGVLAEELARVVAEEILRADRVWRERDENLKRFQ